LRFLLSLEPSRDDFISTTTTTVVVVIFVIQGRRRRTGGNDVNDIFTLRRVLRIQLFQSRARGGQLEAQPLRSSQSLRVRRQRSIITILAVVTLIGIITFPLLL
jgi:hypothetical protein